MQAALTTAAENSEDSAVADFLMLLEEHKKKCEAAGKYIEADIAKKRCAVITHTPAPPRLFSLRRMLCCIS